MPKIVITTDGKTTTAKLYRHGEKTVKAIAKCDPRDTFDFMEGARIAFDRLKISTNEKPKFNVGDFARVKVHLGFYGHIFHENTIVKVKEVEDSFNYNCIGYYGYGKDKGFTISQIIHPDDLEPFNFDEETVPF